MLDTPSSLADRLVQEGSRVVDFFNQLSPEQWSIPVFPAQSTWSFHQLLAHFVSAEIGRRRLIDDICKNGAGAPAEFIIDDFNRSEVEIFSRLSHHELINRFIVERKELAEMISKLSADDLLKTGRDPFLGVTPVSDIIKLTYRHLQIHLREARRVLA